MRRTRSRARRGLTSLLAGLAVATPGAAVLGCTPVSAATTGAATVSTTTGSIVYLKNGYVWIAHSDGSGARQFTLHAFHWSSPSEADNGTIVVAGGRPRVNPDGSDSSGGSEIYRFRPDGNQIGTRIPTWGSYSTPACPTYGPQSVEVSPDASKIAYGIWECASAGFTTLWTPSSATGLYFPHQKTGQLDYFEPHWVNSSVFLVSHVGTTVTDTQDRWYIHGVTQGDNVAIKGWVDPRITGSGAQAVISRAGDKLAIFSDDAADWLDGKPRSVQLWLYTGQNIPDGWTRRCIIKLPATQIPKPLYLHPSFSPDGKHLIWGDSKGVEDAWTGNPGTCSSYRPHLLIAGGSQPFFSAGAEQPGAASPRQPG